MNTQNLKTKARDTVMLVVDKLKAVAYTGEGMEPQGFFLAIDKNEEFLMVPIVGFSGFFTSEEQKNMMQSELKRMADFTKGLFKNGEKLFAFAFVSEAFYYTTDQKSGRYTPPSEHPDRKETLMVSISYEDEQSVYQFPILRCGNQVVFEPMFEMSKAEGSIISGRFTDLLK
jgi:hypothetical protein